MKRDMDTIFQLLESIEESEIRSFDVNFYTDIITPYPLTKYHLYLCGDEKLIQYELIENGVKARLTWKGHDFIEEYRRKNKLA